MKRQWESTSFIWTDFMGASWWSLRVGTENPVSNQITRFHFISIPAFRCRSQYSHGVRSSAAVALLADDRCSEVLGVGERQSIQSLQRGQTKQRGSVPLCQTLNETTKKIYPEGNLSLNLHQWAFLGFNQHKRYTIYIWQYSCRVCVSTDGNDLTLELDFTKSIKSTLETGFNLAAEIKCEWLNIGPDALNREQ